MLTLFPEKICLPSPLLHTTDLKQNLSSVESTEVPNKCSLYFPKKYVYPLHYYTQ